jgi:hypothetical protein
VPHRESRRGGWRASVKTSGCVAVVIASLFVLASAIDDGPATEPRPLAADHPRPPRTAAPRPSLTFGATPQATSERGEFGLPMLLVQSLADPRLSSATGGLAGRGLTAEAFRDLYEADPGEAARFMFARRASRADWRAPPRREGGSARAGRVSGSAGR